MSISSTDERRECRLPVLNPPQPSPSPIAISRAELAPLLRAPEPTHGAEQAPLYGEAVSRHVPGDGAQRLRTGIRLAGKLMTSSPPTRIGAPGSGAQAMAVITSQVAGSCPPDARSGS